MSDFYTHVSLDTLSSDTVLWQNLTDADNSLQHCASGSFQCYVLFERSWNRV